MKELFTRNGQASSNELIHLDSLKKKINQFVGDIYKTTSKCIILRASLIKKLDAWKDGLLCIGEDQKYLTEMFN